MKQQQPLIIAAQQKFKDWRDSKLPGGKIPKELWGIVRQILFNPKYKITHITRDLGVSTKQLKHKFPEYFSKLTKFDKTLVKPTPKFIQASLAPLTQVMPSTAGLLTIPLCQGSCRL